MQNNIRPDQFGRGGWQFIGFASASAAAMSAVGAAGDHGGPLGHVDAVMDWHRNAYLLGECHRAAGALGICDTNHGGLSSADSAHRSNTGSGGHRQGDRNIQTLLTLLSAAAGTLRFFHFGAAQGLVFIGLIDSQCNSLVSHGKQRGGNLTAHRRPGYFPAEGSAGYVVFYAPFPLFAP